MKREGLALILTGAILVSLVAFAQPASALVATVTGPDEVTVGETVTYDLMIEAQGDEDISISGLELEFISTKTGESVNVTVTPDGTATEFDPSEGVVGNHGIDIDELRRTLQITPVERDDGVGYGYGYGDGGSSSTLTYLITFNTDAFVPGGEYALKATVTTFDDTEFESNEKRFKVKEDSEDS